MSFMDKKNRKRTITMEEMYQLSLLMLQGVFTDATHKELGKAQSGAMADGIVMSLSAFYAAATDQRDKGEEIFMKFKGMFYQDIKRHITNIKAQTLLMEIGKVSDEIGKIIDEEISKLTSEAIDELLKTLGDPPTEEEKDK